MNLVQSVDCPLGAFTDFQVSGLPFNGVVFIPEIAEIAVVSSLWLHFCYPEVIGGDSVLVSARELRITSKATYIYEGGQTNWRLYLGRRAVARSGLLVEFWSY